MDDNTTTITRIDISDDGNGYTVKKYPDEWRGRAGWKVKPEVKLYNYNQFDPQKAIAWLEERGWTVRSWDRRFSILSEKTRTCYRAFKKLAPVRSVDAIKRLRGELETESIREMGILKRTYGEEEFAEIAKSIVSLHPNIATPVHTLDLRYDL